MSAGDAGKRYILVRTRPTGELVIMDETPARLRLDADDVLGLLGLGLLGAGLWMWWPPAALMICGGLLLGLSVLRARTRRGSAG